MTQRLMSLVVPTDTQRMNKKKDCIQQASSNRSSSVRKLKSSLVCGWSVTSARALSISSSIDILQPAQLITNNLYLWMLALPRWVTIRAAAAEGMILILLIYQRSTETPEELLLTDSPSRDSQDLKYTRTIQLMQKRTETVVHTQALLEVNCVEKIHYNHYVIAEP